MPSSVSSLITVTINLDNLAAAAVAASSVVDNSSNLYDSVQCYLKLTPGSIRPGGFVLVGLMASVDNVNFTNSSASELTLLSSNGNLQNAIAAVHYVTLNNLPPFFKFYVHNRTGDKFSATAGDNTLSYCGVKN